MRKLISGLLVLFLMTIPVAAQNNNSLKPDEWVPTGVWPFLNKNFRVGTVTSGAVGTVKTQVPCNIHIGNQTLWYSQNDTLMEALPGSVIRVEFGDDIYVAINQQVFGKIVREDGKDKVFRVREVDQEEMEKRAQAASNMSMFQLDGPTFGTFTMDMLSQYVSKPEEQPLPILDTFYFYFRGNLFEAKEKEILKYINPARKKEYKAYTRSAEVLSHNERSVLKLWDDFFVHY